VTVAGDVEGLLRAAAPQALGALVRRFGNFDACEDALQDALLAAATGWPADGPPDEPAAWLVTVARRRLVDRFRSDEARRRREDAVAAAAPLADAGPDGEGGGVPARDDTLTLLFLCCHPELTPASQLALTLRAVGGLTTAEVAHALLVPEATMGQRISRAKARIKASGARFGPPPPGEWDDRLRVVLQVLYLIFNEGHAATAGPSAARGDLTAEAIRLARAVRRLLPDDGEVAGLLALMLLTEARRPARARADGSLVPLAEQDRSLWDRAAVDEGIPLVRDALTRGPVGPYQLQAAIAAVHAEAATAEETDWVQVVALYDVLERVAPSPIVTLNRAVAVAMADSARAGLAVLATVEDDPRLTAQHRLDAVRAHLLELAGDSAGALAAYRAAARRTTSIPERRYLDAQAARLAADLPPLPTLPPDATS